jgi:hypothetical protein
MVDGAFEEARWPRRWSGSPGSRNASAAAWNWIRQAHRESFWRLKQPFILGSHPDTPTLESWMIDEGWKRWAPPTDLAMIQNQTWRRDRFIATDVRPENALIAESDGMIRAIDFIMGHLSE